MLKIENARFGFGNKNDIDSHLCVNQSAELGQPGRTFIYKNRLPIQMRMVIVNKS